MTARRIKTSIALAIILGSCAWLYFAFNPIPPAPDLEPHKRLGQRTGEEAVKLLAGGKLVLIIPDTQTFPNTCADAQLKAFHAVVKKANIAVVATNAVKIDPNRAVRLDAGTVAPLLRKYKETDVIVSFMGPPVIPQEQRHLLPKKTARVIAVCSDDFSKYISLQPIFEQGLLQAAIVCRLDQKASTDIQVITSATASETR
jgi:hypothetical protein